MSCNIKFFYVQHFEQDFSFSFLFLFSLFSFLFFLFRSRFAFHLVYAGMNYFTHSLKLRSLALLASYARIGR